MNSTFTQQFVATLVKDVSISREGSPVAAGIDADTYSSYRTNSRFPQKL